MSYGIQERADIEDAAHLSLELGRLLLMNGAETAHVRTAVERFSCGLGYESRLLISYEALLLTIVAGEQFRTKVGLHVPATNVNMSSVENLNLLVEDTAAGKLAISEVAQRLTMLEQQRPLHSRWLIAPSLGLTAASLSTLFGGDWPAFVTVFVAATVGTIARQQLGRWIAHPLAMPLLVAFVSGTIGGLGMKLHPGIQPALCLIAPGMILVPGVPLITSLRDVMNNSMELSLARLSFSILVVVAIALGLFAATAVTGVGIPISGPASLLPISEDALFSALATVGFVLLFNVRARVAWACILCGVCCHALRTALMHFGLDIIGGTLIASAVAGILAHAFARYFNTPAATFAFPSVVALVPGSYAFRAVIGGIQILHTVGSAPAALVGETISLFLNTVLLTSAIAIGVALALAVPLPHFPRERHPG